MFLNNYLNWYLQFIPLPCIQIEIVKIIHSSILKKDKVIILSNWKANNQNCFIYSLDICLQTQSPCSQQLHRHGQHEVKVLYPSKVKKSNLINTWTFHEYQSLFWMWDKNVPDVKAFKLKYRLLVNSSSETWWPKLGILIFWDVSMNGLVNIIECLHALIF